VKRSELEVQRYQFQAGQQVYREIGELAFQLEGGRRAVQRRFNDRFDGEDAAVGLKQLVVAQPVPGGRPDVGRTQCIYPVHLFHHALQGGDIFSGGKGMPEIGDVVDDKSEGDPTQEFHIFEDLLDHKPAVLYGSLDSAVARDFEFVFGGVDRSQRAGEGCDLDIRCCKSASLVHLEVQRDIVSQCT
jgi:hypothetical protein